METELNDSRMSTLVQGIEDFQTPSKPFTHINFVGEPDLTPELIAAIKQADHLRFVGAGKSFIASIVSLGASQLRLEFQYCDLPASPSLRRRTWSVEIDRCTGVNQALWLDESLILHLPICESVNLTTHHRFRSFFLHGVGDFDAQKEGTGRSLLDGNLATWLWRSPELFHCSASDIAFTASAFHQLFAADFLSISLYRCDWPTDFTLPEFALNDRTTTLKIEFGVNLDCQVPALLAALRSLNYLTLDYLSPDLARAIAVHPSLTALELSQAFFDGDWGFSCPNIQTVFLQRAQELAYPWLRGRFPNAEFVGSDLET